MDDEVGSICDVGWSRYDATVACKQLNFTDGEFKRYVRSHMYKKHFKGTYQCMLSHKLGATR